MHATIIGIEGGMGQWMKTHLAGLGYTVSGFDERRGDTPSILGQSDLVVISVPLKITAEVVRKTVTHMKQGACLMEIASLKSGIHEAMTEAAESGLDVLCVHPMWGPSTCDLKEKTVAVIPVVDVEHEKKETLKLFPGTSIEIVDAEEHDRLMSIILSLPYLINMALAATIKDENLIKLRKLAGTTFTLQYLLTQSVVEEKTSLIEALLSKNTQLDDVSTRFIQALNTIRGINNSTQLTELHAEIQNSMGKDQQMQMKAHEIRQKIYDSIQPLLR